MTGATAADDGDLHAQYSALRDGVGVVDRSAAGSVVVSGPDTFSFLDSLISADISDLADGAGVHSLLLSPRGKLDTDFRLLRVGDVAWIDTEPGFAEALVASLLRFRIRVDVEIADRSATWGLLQVRGPGTDDLLLALGAEPLPEGVHAHVPWEGTRLVRVDRPAGVDVLGDHDALGAAGAALVEQVATPVGPEAAEAHRIVAGVPLQGRDLDESTIPQEAGLEFDAVSFDKGCFLGQELVCRIDSRGRVNRFLRLLHTEGPAPTVGAEILSDDDVVGSVTSVALTDPGDAESGAVALGYLHRRVEPPATVGIRLSSGDLVDAQVSALGGSHEGS